jgi:hypothetical protein
MPRSVVIERDDDRARGGMWACSVLVARWRKLACGRQNWPLKGLMKSRRLGCFPFRLLWFELLRVVAHRPL